MNLRCVFHVPTITIQTAEQKETRARMPSLLDLDITWDDEPRPRGRSFETWNRARGWETED